MDFPDLTQAAASTPAEATPDLTQPGAPPPMADATVEARARRADLAMGDKSPGVQPLKDAFNSGQEPAVRSQIAGQARADFQQAKLAQIRNWIGGGVPIKDDQLNALMQASSGPGQNPETSIEDKFGQNFVASGVVGDPSNNEVFSKAFGYFPDQINRNIQVAQNIVSRNAQAKNFLEEAQSSYDQIPWVDTSGSDQEDKLGNTIKNLVTLGFREYAQQRNLVTQNAANTSILPGTNKLEQIQALYLLPQDQFLPALKAAAGPGSELWKTNPSAALDFIRAATSFSSSDAYVDNAFAISNVASMLPISTGLKAISRLVGSREIPSVAFQSGLQAAQDVLRTSPKAPQAAASDALKSGTSTAEDILRGSSAPPAQRYYVPGAAIERNDHVGATKTSGATKVPDLNYTVNPQTGEPTVFNAEGVPIQLSRTPEEGHYPLTVERQPEVNTYTTEKGGTTPYTLEKQDYSANLGTKQPDNRTIVNDRPTIFVDKKGYETLSQALDEDKPGSLAEHPNDPNKYFVMNENGKRVTNSTVQVSHEPKPGLYPIHVPEGNDKLAFEDFGSRVSRVEANQPYKVNFGAKIAPTADVESRKALSDIVKATAETEPQDALTKMGQTETAAQIGASRDLQQMLNQQVPETAEDIRRRVPSLFSPQSWFHNASSLSRDMSDRILNTVLQQNRAITSALNDPVRVERLTQEAWARAIQDAKDTVKTDPRWNRNSDSIRDQQVHYNAQTNTYRLETKFGKKDGSLFDTSAQADNYRKEQYKLGSSATVQQEGNKFYLSHMQDIDETLRATRDGLVVAENETPHGAINTALNWMSGKATNKLGNSFRSSRYTLSDFQSQNRVVATHASSTMNDLVKEVGEPLVNLSKQERQELQRVLEDNRDFMHSDGTRGQFYQTAGDFEQGFFNIHNKMPSPAQTQAYDTYVRLNDLDWMLRAFQLHRDKARQGIRSYAVELPGKDDNGLPNTIKTDFFDGKKVDSLGVTKQDANVYVIPQSRMATKFEADTPLKRELASKIKSGEWNVIQVANPREKPLMATTGYKDDVHFIVTSAYDDKPLQIGDGMNYNPGGHVINRDPYFLKVPVIGPGHNGKDTHFGDLTFKSFATEREGRMWEQRYNEAREHLLNNREPELQAMFDAGKFPETLSDFKKIYTGGGLNAETKNPFVLTSDARTTFQSSKELRDKFPGLAEQWSSYNLSQSYNKDFLAERDMVLNTITGKEGQWENTASRLYDPYTALQRGLQQIGRERWMGDYKTQAAESWIAEFSHLFPQDTLPREKLEQNPWYWVYHAPGNLDAGLAKTNPDLYTAAMVSRQNIVNFLGARDEVGSVMAGMERKVLDWIEPKLGTTNTARLETNVLPFIKDVPTYIRRAAFHAVDGLFNPVQLIQQAQDMGRIIAISPKNGLNGVTAGALSRFYRTTEDPAILQSMLSKAEKLGWDQGHFQEAFNAWKASGLHTIGGEVAALNDVTNPTVFRSGFRTFLDKGLMFFRKGEQITRDTSFFTAYKDWRDDNPGVALTNRNIGEIMKRADTLTGNMTRASNAAYNEGWLSIPTQFWNWNARFTEQMLDGGFLRSGRQLTSGEKARVLGMYSALYGIPATMGGVGFGVIPMANYDDIRQYALAHGYNVSDKYFEAFSEGLPAMLTNMITGHHTDYQRFGPNANQLKDILDGKKDVYQTILGASGGFAGNVAQTLYPFTRFAISALQGKWNDYPLKMNDLVNVAENVSSFNNAEKAIIGLNAGKLWSKKDQLIDNNIDTFESFALALGLNPKRDSDAFLMKDYLKKLKDTQDKMRPTVLQQWSNGLGESAKGNFQSANEYFARAKSLSALADFSNQDQSDLFKQAMTGENLDLVDQAEKQWRENLPALRSIPALNEYFKNLKQHYR